MTNNVTSYRVIGFGTKDYGFFNQFHWGATLQQAEASYSEMGADPEIDGAVVIEVGTESWRVIREFGTEGVSVVASNYGVFKVERAPVLHLV